MTVIQFTTAPSFDRCQKPKKIRATDLALAMVSVHVHCTRPIQTVSFPNNINKNICFFFRAVAVLLRYIVFFCIGSYVKKNRGAIDRKKVLSGQKEIVRINSPKKKLKIQNH